MKCLDGKKYLYLKLRWSLFYFCQRSRKYKMYQQRKQLLDSANYRRKQTITTEATPEKVQEGEKEQKKLLCNVWNSQLETTVENATQKKMQKLLRKADAGEVEEVNKDANNEKLNVPTNALRSL